MLHCIDGLWDCYMSGRIVVCQTIIWLLDDISYCQRRVLKYNQQLIVSYYKWKVHGTCYLNLLIKSSLIIMTRLSTTRFHTACNKSSRSRLKAPKKPAYYSQHSIWNSVLHTVYYHQINALSYTILYWTCHLCTQTFSLLTAKYISTTDINVNISSIHLNKH